MRKFYALVAVLVLVLPIGALDGASAKTPAPTQAQIDAAKAAEAANKKGE